MPKIIRPGNIAWLVFWTIMAVHQGFTGEWFGAAAFAAFATWNWFSATRESVGPF